MDLYYLPGSAPCRAVLMTLKAVGIYDQVNLKLVNLMAGEHLTPEYLKVISQSLQLNDNRMIDFCSFVCF